MDILVPKLFEEAVFIFIEGPFFVNICLNTAYKLCHSVCMLQ